MLFRALAVLALIPVCARAGLNVDGGFVRIVVGTASTLQVPVQVTGGDLVSDMAAVVETSGPAAQRPRLTAVSFAGSIWQGAAGGFVSFFTDPPPAFLVGPNVSLSAAGQRVAGTGLLMTLTLDVAGLAPGDYTVRFAGTSQGSTVFAAGLAAVPATFSSGIVRIAPDQFQLWQLARFPGSAPNPATEATVWGPFADPDRDGVVNLTEFLCGTDPNIPGLPAAGPTAPGLPVRSTTVIAGQTYPTLAFTRRILREPVRGDAEASSDLVTWSSAGFVESAPPVTLPGGEFEYIVLRHSVPLTGPQPRQFLRVNVQRR